MKRLTIAGTALLTLAVAGCGGGGYDDHHDDGFPPGSALDRAAGFYEGTTLDQRKISVIVLETGRYYATYGPAAIPTSPLIEGVLVGDGTASGSTFSSSVLQNLNFSSLTRTPGVMSATFALRSYFDANINYVGGTADSFKTDYSFRYEDVPALALVAGTYNGQLAALSGVDTAAVTISNSGALSVTTAGCSAAGAVLLHPFGNVYDVTLSYGAGCPAAGQTLSGHAKYDATTRSLTAITTSPDFSRVTLLVATKTP